MNDSELFLFTGIIVIWIILIGLRVGSYLDSKIDKKVDIKAAEQPIKEKRCPAHKWRWEEQIGMEGTFCIRCQWCRKLPGWMDEK